MKTPPLPSLGAVQPDPDGYISLRPSRYKDLCLHWWRTGVADMLKMLPKPTPTDFTPKTYLHTWLVSGNMHDAARAVGNVGWSDFLVQIESSGYSSIVVLRFPVGWPMDEHGPCSATQALLWAEAHKGEEQ